MNFDRNTITGFLLLAVLFIGFFWYTNREQAMLQKEKAEQARKDSIENAKKPKPVPQPVAKDTTNYATSAPVVDSSDLFYTQRNGKEQKTVVETELMKVVFTNKGGQPDYVELKKFKAPDSSHVKLAASEFDKISYVVKSKTKEDKTDSISHLYFTGGTPVKNADGSTTVTYQLQSADGKIIQHQYVVKPEDYMVDFNLDLTRATSLFSNNDLVLVWKNKAGKLERDLTYEKTMSEISFVADNEFDYYKIDSRSEKEFKDPVKWVANKQRFFNSALVAKDKEFSSGRIEWAKPADGVTIADATAILRYSLANSQSLKLGLYYGPNEYKTLKQYGNDMEDMVDLGRGMWAFVKWINRWIVLPIFNLLSQMTTSMGIAILLLTLFIRLVTSPLMYPGYVTSAKMKILRPELEQLKAKYPDQQQYAMEQMKFVREAGVNQFAGCLPGLLQIPIFFSLYSFFNSSAALRGQAFLWSKDLSQYDSILNLPFSIPFYGDHVSLFTITACLTSFLISLYGMSSMGDQGNPVLKYMPYIFPVILLFFFNSLPSGLTWYYTVSNIITLILQFVIQNYIINHDKLIAKIEENRKKPKKQSKWAERMAQMQEQQKQMREMQQKRNR